jgi:peroxiredoxin
MKRVWSTPAGRRPPRRSGLARVVVAALAVALALAGCRGDGGQAPDPNVPVGIELGQRAPALNGTRHDGREYQLSPGGSGSVLVFFRGYHCGLCRERLRELQSHLAEYEQAGARIVAVTADEPEQARRAVEELGLGFPVVTVDSTTLTQWGLVGDPNPLPLPASYLLDRRGVIAFRHIGRNAADRAHDLEILAALQELRGR